ncbi:Na+/H+ antiporter NhaA [Nitrosococcus wardiae]|uniref:Na+/H+ antiporter NhaA n=1 Tax=Nitrosococcus wardiae TaxID=1814290 RepID=UPI0019825D5A|nr:Na+/H+ antiporter NhaA [Nitrosococcus wardiae]
MAEKMRNGSPINKQISLLPQERIDWLTKPIARFLRIESMADLVLLLFTLSALVLSNSLWSPPFLEVWETPVGLQIGPLEFTRSLREWINDALMTLFFFLVALELKRERVFGELRNPRLAALSIMAALGGMLVPALFYLMLQVRPTRPEWLGHGDGHRHRLCHRLSGAVRVAHSPKSTSVHAVPGHY